MRFFSELPPARAAAAATAAAAAAAPPPPRRGMQVTLASTGEAVNDSFAWSTWALAEPTWARAEAASFALGGAGNFGRGDWGGIADYACQGGLIAEKLLSMGGAAERAEVLGWLLTMPVSAAGAAWEAQNSQWHVGTQGAWESSAEALIALRHAAAHGAAAAPAFSRASERLVCASRDGGASFELAGSGVAAPGLPVAACAMAPAALLAALPLSGSAACAAAELFTDTPSAPHPGPDAARDNGGRLLTQALLLPDGATTHISLALSPRVTGASAWPSTVSVVDVASGLVVAGAALPAGGAPPDRWSVLDVRDGKGAPLPAGLYLVVLTSAPQGPRPQDSWFLGASWVTNACPAASGGASQATYGASALWLRNASAAANDPKLVTAFITTPDAAVALEARRLRATAAAGGGLGVSIGQQASLLLSFVLALSSQTPSSAPGNYDVFVIPDPLFRGSFEDGVNSACSYYDLLRMGFASSYISLRALEAVEAFAELQAAGLVAAACAGSGGSAFGVDNANVLAAAATPCYSAPDVLRIAETVRAAIGARFSDAATGSFIDWLGCASLGGPAGGSTTDCGLADVVGGAPPPGSPLTAVRTGFLPTLALAAKLGVPAGGTGEAGVNVTRRAFAAARDEARQGTFYGAGWFHNALRGLEANEGGARSLIVHQDWKLQDADGFAIHNISETGDWHIFSPAFVAGGGALGYGQFEGQAENGGRFPSTTAFVLEGGVSAAAGPYPYTALLSDWLRFVRDITAAGEQLAAGPDVSRPLLAADPAFLSTPVTDAVVFQLCATVRKQAGFKNVTDAWGAYLCDYYQDVAWALPENGVVLWSAAKALLGIRVRADSSLEVNGARVAVPGAASAPLPAGWPADAARVQVWSVAVGGAAVDIDCSPDAALLRCSVVASSQARV